MAEFTTVIRHLMRAIDAGSEFINFDWLESLFTLRSAGRYREEEVVDFEKAVMRFAETHPERTFKDVLLEKFPEASLDCDGVPILCPATLGLVKCDKCSNHCEDCWNRPVPETINRRGE